MEELVRKLKKHIRRNGIYTILDFQAPEYFNINRDEFIAYAKTKNLNIEYLGAIRIESKKWTQSANEHMNVNFIN